MILIILFSAMFYVCSQAHQNYIEESQQLEISNQINEKMKTEISELQTAYTALTIDYNNLISRVKESYKVEDINLIHGITDLDIEDYKDMILELRGLSLDEDATIEMIEEKVVEIQNDIIGRNLYLSDTIKMFTSLQRHHIETLKQWTHVHKVPYSSDVTSDNDKSDKKSKDKGKDVMSHEQ
jgi:hypothetical protein